MQPVKPLATHEPNRTAAARRLYFYVFSFVSLVALLIAFDQLLEILCRVWLDSAGADAINSAEYIRNSIALNGGILLVATPLFLIHWNVIRHSMTDAAERVSSLRKLFLYLVSAVTAFYLLLHGYSLLRAFVDVALGNPPDPDLFPSGWLHLPIFLLAAGALHRYIFRILVSDGDFGHEQASSGLWRRLYLTLAGLTGLLLLLFATAQALTILGQVVVSLWMPVVGNHWWQDPVAGAVSRAVLGFLLLRSTWIRWEALATDNEAERASSLRRLYLYAALLISGVTALVAIATTLRIVLLIAFGAEQGETSEIIDQIVAQAGLFSAGLGSWLWFRSHVRQEVRLYAESEAGATARRLYFYVLAGLGLGLMWVGAGDLIQAFLSRIFGQGGTQPLWTSPLATGLSLLIVGTPVWTLHWRTVQQRVDGDSRAAFAERHAWPRRFYLFAAILVGALIFLFQLARVVYTVLLLLLGDPFAEFFSLETTAMIAGAAIAALVWTGHAALLRRDNQILAVSPYVEEETQPVDAVQQRQRLNAQIARLEAELATARQALEALEEHPQD